MNSSVKTIITLALFFSLVSVVTLLNEPDSSITDGKQCELDDSLSCRFSQINDNSQQVIVKFVEKVQVEEQNEVIVTLPADASLDDVWIQGVNMFMGKVAVLAQSSNEQNVHNLQFFLGACSEANMRWQFVLAIKKASDAKPETYFINFKTTI